MTKYADIIKKPSWQKVCRTN